MILYTVEYCPCIYESEFSTISLHETLVGAYKAKRRLILAGFEVTMSLPKKFHLRTIRDRPFRHVRFRIQVMATQR